MANFQDALALASRGFKVFPIAPGAKAPPLWANWPERATSAVPTDWPTGANVGIHCAGLCVIDVDPRKGGDETLTQIEIETDGLPPTLTSRTPSGGRHLFYRLPEGNPGVPNRVNAFGPGIDIRSTGGYVVGVGSTTPAGGYDWVYDTPLADAPLWLLDALGRAQERQPAPPIPDADPATVERAVAWLAGREGAVEGQGGDAWTFGTAAFLRDFGLSPRQAYEALLEWNAKCSPPWGLDDLWQKVVNAYAYADGPPGAKAVTADDFPDIVQEKPLSTTGEQAPKVDRRIPVAMGTIAAGPSTVSPYIVKGLLYKRAYAMIYGAPGEGKTFVALDIAYHIAAGREWMGRRVRQGLTLYVGFEAYGGLANRARALRRKYQADAPLYFVGGGFDLRTAEGRRAFGEILAALPEKPVLIVYDTFAYALAGGDENSSQDVGTFNSAVQALIEATGACVLLVHHTGKDANKGARGSSALPAAIDTELAIADRTITPTKQREVELGGPITFALVPIMIGTDEDGDSIMSCGVDPAAAEVQRPRAKRGPEDAVLAELERISPSNAPVSIIDLAASLAGFGLGRVAVGSALKALVDKGLVERSQDGNYFNRKMV
jgi:hypothetical protein